MSSFASAMKTALAAGIWDNYYDELMELQQTSEFTTLDDDWVVGDNLDDASNFTSDVGVFETKGDLTAAKIDNGYGRDLITDTQFIYYFKLWVTDATHEYFAAIYDASNDPIGGFKLHSDGNIYKPVATVWTDTGTAYTAGAYISCMLYYKQNDRLVVCIDGTEIINIDAPDKVPAYIEFSTTDVLWFTKPKAWISNLHPMIRIIGVNSQLTNQYNGVDLLNMDNPEPELAMDGSIAFQFLNGQIEVFSPLESMRDAMKLDIESILKGSKTFRFSGSAHGDVNERYNHIYTVSILGC